MTADAGVIWGGVVPLRTGLSAAEAVRSWAVGCGARRLLLVFDGGRYPENAAAALIAALETAGVAVFPFDHAGDHAGGASVGDVAEGVGAYHFDQCDAVVGVGTGAIVDLATLVAFMSGQRHPLTDLAAVSANIDPRGVAPSFAVATDLTGVAALGGASLILDDRGCPFLLRDAALRPAAAAYCPAPGVGGLVEGREIVAALAIDAGDGGAADSLMATTAGDASSLALDIAGLLERRLGPARVLAVYGMIAGGIPQPATLACLIATSGVGADVAAALDPSRTARPLLDALSLDALAHIDRTTLPVDISGMLVMLGRDIPAPRRRGGRGGAARGRRSE